jgi:phosphohistidine phosphatase SixA
MRLYLLRHGEAEPTHPDADRKLTDKGIEEITRVAHGLAIKKKHQPASLWVSPLRRAQQTADLFCREIGWDMEREIREDLVPGANPARVARELTHAGQSCILVGHNPHLEILLSYLLSGRSDGILILLNTGSIACVEFPQVGPSHGNCILRWVVSPKMLGV